MIAIQRSERSKSGNPQVSRKLPPQFSEIKATDSRHYSDEFERENR